MDNVSTPGDRESFEGHIVPNAAFDLSMYEANEDYFFAAYRLLSWFPVVNVWGKTYFADDITPDVLQTLTGSEVNLFHDASKIVGIVVDAAITINGLDVLIRMKRSALQSQNVEIEDVINLLNKCSLELRKDTPSCDYLVLNDDLSVDRTIPLMAGMRSGMRPTSQNDPVPFMYRNQQRVVERVRPTRFTGVGLLNNPADKTALGYGIVASDDIPEIPVAPVQEPAGESENKDTRTMELEQALAALKEANDKLAVYENETASAKTAQETLATKNAELAAENERLNTELASASEKAGALQSEKDAQLKEQRTAQILSDFVAILAPDSDEDKALYQERAAAACDDNGVIREFTLDLREKKLERAETAAQAAAAAPAAEPAVETPAEPAAEPAPAGADPVSSDTEQASAGSKPAVAFVPAYDGGTGASGNSSDNLLLLA